MINKLGGFFLALCCIPSVLAASEGNEPLERLRTEVLHALDGRVAAREGSRAGVVDAQDAARYEWLALRAHAVGPGVLDGDANELAEGLLRLLDPIWGGAFTMVSLDRIALSAEKRLAVQADALRAFTDAWLRTRESRYRRAIDNVDGYLLAWLAAPGGLFHTSQEAQPPDLPGRVGVGRYWSLAEHDRRRFGIPPIRTEVDAADNASLLDAYARTYAATGEPNQLAVAVGLANALLAPLPQAVAGDARRAAAWTVLGLLSLYSASDDARWLAAAEPRAEALRDRLAQAAEHDPHEADAVAARAFLELATVQGHRRWVREAAQTLLPFTRSDAASSSDAALARLGITLEVFAGGVVECVVAGDAADPRTRVLLEAARRAYHPRKLVHRAPAARFPPLDQPAAYLCTADACTLPIIDPGAIAAELEPLRAPGVEFPDLARSH